MFDASPPRIVSMVTTAPSSADSFRETIYCTSFRKPVYAKMGAAPWAIGGNLSSVVEVTDRLASKDCDTGRLLLMVDSTIQQRRTTPHPRRSPHRIYPAGHDADCNIGARQAG